MKHLREAHFPTTTRHAGRPRRLSRLKSGLAVTLVLSVVLFATNACGDLKEADRKRMPRISRSRPIGSPAGPTDSASIKRVDFHPLGESNGWNYGNGDFVDQKRSKAVKTNSLMQFYGSIVGFVRFDKPGYLQTRVYDDLYGDVYCGWSPHKLEIKPSPNPAYVSIGLAETEPDSIQEVCWFPAGAKDGVVVYSTAYPDVGEKLSAADVYGKEQLGNEYRFNDDIAANAINAYLQCAQFNAARKVLNDSANLLKSMRDAQDGSTGKPITAKKMNAQKWATLKAYEAGLSLGEPNFKARLQELEAALHEPHWPETTADPTEREYEGMLPLYSWLNQQVVGQKSAVPTFDKSKTYIAGHDPKTVIEYLEADKATEDQRAKLMFCNIDFWIAVKNFLHKDFKESEKHLDIFLKDKHEKGDAFEVAAAAKLKEFEFFELHPEK